jgi:ubiquinone/menaquinone biosynthesis C-methylase UbiE
VSSIGVLLLTTIHHVYGAAIYNTPWRNHVAFISLPAAFFIAGALFASGKYPNTTFGRVALWSAITAIVVIPFGAIGLFEGGYNHVIKNALYFSGAPFNLMRRLFPPPAYELPDDLFFELTGVLQFFVALPAGYYAYRLLYPSRKGKKEKYIPAMGFDLLTPLYDSFVKWFMPESRFKKHLIEQASIQPGQRVLDLGCGTATLTILIKQTHPHTEVTGLDGDAKILKIASRKIARTGVEITLNEGLASQLPYSDKSFDRVVSSLVLHHLTVEDRRLALSEAFRILRPGGELHVADFGRPNKPLPAMFREVGFEQAEESVSYATIFGKLCLWRARRPAEATQGGESRRPLPSNMGSADVSLINQRYYPEGWTARQAVHHPTSVAGDF